MLSTDEKILSMDKIFTCQKHPWIEKSYPWIKVSSIEKIMDNLFICGCHTWMKSNDKDNQWCIWTQPKAANWNDTMKWKFDMRLVDREPPKGSKWPAEGLHYTWGSTRGSAHTRVPLGADWIPICLGLRGCLVSNQAPSRYADRP